MTDEQIIEQLIPVMPSGNIWYTAREQAEEVLPVVRELLAAELESVAIAVEGCRNAPAVIRGFRCGPGVGPMNPTKMRHQRGRVRPTARPAEFAAHPESRMQWQSEVILLPRGRAQVVCSHCKRWTPCPTEEYLHGQAGHWLDTCGGPDRCDVFERARYAREHEHGC